MTQGGKGGSDAAFFIFLGLFFAAVVGFGGSLQYPLAVLRAGGYGAAATFLWNRRKEPVPLGPYPLLVGGFVLLSLGHSFSSVYFWVSFQHALNVGLAAVLLAWAYRLFRGDPERSWSTATLAVAAFALVEVGIALFQHLQGGEMRPRGTFDNANYLSEFLAAASILCLARALWPGEGQRTRPAWGGGAILFLVTGLALGGSRGVLLASLPAFGLLLACRFGLRKGGALLGGLGAPVLLLLGLRAAGRFFEADPVGYGRWIIWKSALRTFLDHPFGVGLGGFKYHWFATQSSVEGGFRRYWKYADTAHNEYLEVLTGLGLAGFLLFLALLAVPLVLAFRKRARIPEERVPAAAGAAAVLVLSGVHALVNANFHVFGIFFLDAAMLGALLSCMPGEAKPAVTLPAWTRVAGIGACAAALAAAGLTVAGAALYDRGEGRLGSGDLPGAEQAFRLALTADPFRSVYPDALSGVHYRRYLAERPSMAVAGGIPEPFFEALRWEDRARELSPRDPRYALRLSRLFFELYRLRGDPSDARMALRLSDEALRVNPYGADILWHRADLLTYLGRREEAIRELEAAVSVEPNFCRGYARLAELARGSDPAGASRWAMTAQECRAKAATLPLEEHEKWLLESPEKQ